MKCFAQCENSKIFLLPRFLREINFCELKTSKHVILTILDTMNSASGNLMLFFKIKFQTLKDCQTHKF